MISEILRQFSISTPSKIESLGAAGGFSGARFWRITFGGENFCLRRWPSEFPDARRLQFIHDILGHVASGGLATLPIPIKSVMGKSFIETEGKLWELTPWMPGKADFHDHPNDARLAAAMQTLAQFHLGARSFRTFGDDIPPGISMRREQLTKLLAGELENIAAGIREGAWPALASRARILVELVRQQGPGILQSLNKVSTVRAPLQICIRDIWHDHVLFEGDAVSGIVDFGAMRPDCVAGDIARLLGSLIGDDRAKQEIGITAYESVRTLSPDERSLIRQYDQGNFALSGINWLKWIYLDGRQFDDQSAIEQRLDVFIKRLRERV